MARQNVARAVSPGAALLRSSRLFSVPQPLAEPNSTNLHMGNHKSPTMTQSSPQYQAITTPLSSREKGDWGYKRPLPLRSTMATSTPAIRVKQVDSIESITDFTSAADHALTLEKFQEMRIPLSIPGNNEQGQHSASSKAAMFPKSVFEEDMDFTVAREGKADTKRWKFRGPWLARMTEGDFLTYVKTQVRPRRAEFRKLLLEKLVENLNGSQSVEAADKGVEAPASINPEDVTQEQFSEYLRTLRNDRATLYGLVSKFLDLAPLGQPVGIVQTFLTSNDAAPESPYGKSGPPPSHPSAGISYLRTKSFMENHPVYGPQARHDPVLARVLYPRSGHMRPKLGAGGFVAEVPAGDNEFNSRAIRNNHIHSGKKVLGGISQLDTTTYGGAKAFVDPTTANIDPSGRIVIKLREVDAEAQLIAKEKQGREKVYSEEKRPSPAGSQAKADRWRISTVVDEIMEDRPSGQK